MLFNSLMKINNIFNFNHKIDEIIVKYIFYFVKMNANVYNDDANVVIISAYMTL